MKLAPYGKTLQELVEKPDHIFIFMGKNSWVRAKDFREPCFPATLVLPPNESPFNYFWPVNNYEIYLLDTGITNIIFVREFVAYLFSLGATVVNYLSLNIAMKKFEKECENDI